MDDFNENDITEESAGAENEMELARKRLIGLQGFAQARFGLIGFIVLTLINIALIFIDADLTFLFSAYLPLFSLIYGLAGSGVQAALLIAVGISYLAVLLIMTLLCFRAYWPMIVSCVLVSVDSAVCLYFFFALIFMGEFNAGYIVMLLLHALIEYQVIKALIQGRKLIGAGGRVTDSLKAYAAEMEKQFANINVEAFRASAGDGSDSEALRSASDKGRTLIRADRNGVEIVVKRSRGLTELIIDDSVYAEKKGVVEMGYALEAMKGGVIYRFDMYATGQMTLSADGEVLCKKLRLF